MPTRTGTGNISLTPFLTYRSTLHLSFSQLRYQRGFPQRLQEWVTLSIILSSVFWNALEYIKAYAYKNRNREHISHPFFDLPFNTSSIVFAIAIPVRIPSTITGTGNIVNHPFFSLLKCAWVHKGLCLQEPEPGTHLSPLFRLTIQHFIYRFRNCDTSEDSLNDYRYR